MEQGKYSGEGGLPNEQKLDYELPDGSAVRVSPLSASILDILTGGSTNQRIFSGHQLIDALPRDEHGMKEPMVHIFGSLFEIKAALKETGYDIKQYRIKERGGGIYYQFAMRSGKR